MRLSTLLNIILTLASLALAQPDTVWTRTYQGPGHVTLSGMVPAADGGFYLAGTVVRQGFDRTDAWLVKADANGDSLWGRAYGRLLGNENCGAIASTSDGNYVLAGSSQPDTTQDLYYWWLLKVNPQGDTLWSQMYAFGGFSTCDQVFETSDGGFLIVGGGVRLLKTDAAGDSVWSKWLSVGNFASSESATARQTVDGGYLLAATAHPNGGSSTVWLTKVNAQGDSLWGRTFAQEFNTECGGMQLTPEGGCLIAGRCNLPEPNFPDYCLLRVNAQGDSVSSRFYDPGHDATHCYTLEPTSDGGYVLWGTLNSFADSLWLVRINADGDSLWSRVIHGNAQFSVRYVVHKLASGDFAVAGTKGVYGVGRYWLSRAGLNSGVTPIMIPERSELLSSYPNPFNGRTVIELCPPANAREVIFSVFNLLGEQVDRITIPAAPKIRYAYYANHLGTGIYLLRAEAGSQTRTIKLVLLK